MPTPFEEWQRAWEYLSVNEQTEMNKLASILSDIGPRKDSLTSSIYDRWEQLGQIAVQRYNNTF